MPYLGSLLFPPLFLPFPPPLLSPLLQPFYNHIHTHGSNCHLHAEDNWVQEQTVFPWEGINPGSRLDGKQSMVSSPADMTVSVTSWMVSKTVWNQWILDKGRIKRYVARFYNFLNLQKEPLKVAIRWKRKWQRSCWILPSFSGPLFARFYFLVSFVTNLLNRKCSKFCSLNKIVIV